MESSIVDLRYKMKDILRALDRNESVRVLYHGKLRGTIVPAGLQPSFQSAKDHPAFGASLKRKTVAQTMKELRAGRYDTL